MAAGADDRRFRKPRATRNKLTVSYYDFSSGKDGLARQPAAYVQVNAAWIAGYHESDGFDQARVGYDT